MALVLRFSTPPVKKPPCMGQDVVGALCGHGGRYQADERVEGRRERKPQRSGRPRGRQGTSCKPRLFAASPSVCGQVEAGRPGDRDRSSSRCPRPPGRGPGPRVPFAAMLRLGRRVGWHAEAREMTRTPLPSQGKVLEETQGGWGPGRFRLGSDPGGGGAPAGWDSDTTYRSRAQPG